MTRRDAARKMSLFLAGSPLLRAQDPSWIANRMPALEELNNVMEFEPLARTKMLKAAYDYIAGGVDTSGACDAIAKDSSISRFDRACWWT